MTATDLNAFAARGYTHSALRAMSRFQANVGRVLHDGKVTASRRKIARESLRDALMRLALAESLGATPDATAWVADPLTRSRQRATDLGLLTPAQVIELERVAIAGADAAMAHRRPV